MNSTVCQILRAITGGSSVALLAHESSFCWIAVIPWLFLCLWGIIATLPVVFVIGFLAGAAQADWMSDEFMFGLFFATPTILAIAIAEYVKRRERRMSDASSKPACDS
jgi:hypothetical protein